MTSVTMVTNDSAALHTTKTSDNRNVKEVQAYPSSPAVKPHEDATTAPRQKVKRNQRQRRKQERRRQQTTVLLDTRSGHDRRNVIASQTTETENTGTTPATTGIDIYT